MKLIYTVNQRLENGVQKSGTFIKNTYILLFLCLFTVIIFPRTSAAENIPIFTKDGNIDLSNWYISHGWLNGDHQACKWHKDALKNRNGTLGLLLTEKKDENPPYICSELQSKKRYGYGKYEARIRTASGKGLNTSFFTYIGPVHKQEHDEIDFEFLGKEPTKVQLNFHRNGKSMNVVMVDLGFDASADFHDYAFEWSRDKIKWYADGKLIYESPEGLEIPKHESMIFVSLWAGSDKSRYWLDYFRYKEPLEAQVEWVKFTPADGQ